jgi:hypothetical protein
MLNIKVSGIFKSLDLKVKVVGQWKVVSRLYTKIAGQWRTCHFGNGYRPALGEVFGGGVVVGFRTFNNIEHALIASPLEDQNYGIQFNTGGDLYAANHVFDGYANTQNLFDSRFVAARYCINYAGGGYTDWYLPSEWEMIDAHYGRPSQFHATYYYTSTQVDSKNVRRVLMTNGKASNSNDTTIRYVRPFRRVPLQ